MPNARDKISASTLQHSPTRRRISRQQACGFSLIETMTTVTIMGILATLASYSVRERVNEARSAEAVSMLGNMKKGIKASVNQTWMSGDVLEIGETVTGYGGPMGSPALFGKKKGKKSGGNTYSRTPSKSSGSGSNTYSRNPARGNDKPLMDAGTEGADGNHGHGNDPDGCDASNPSGKCPGAKDKDKDGGDSRGGGNKGSGGNQGPKHDAGTEDSDGNNGHGNDDDGCDSSNPGKSNPCSDDGNDGGGNDGGGNAGGGNDGGGNAGGGNAGGGNDGGGNAGGGNDGGGNAGGGTTPPSDGNPQQRLCGSAEPVPADFSSVSGSVYMAAPSEYQQGDRHNSWACLGVSSDGPQHYQYGYDVGPARVGVPAAAVPGSFDESQSFTAWARGDLDGDGRTSWFILQGAVLDEQVYTGPAIGIVDPEE